MLITYSVLYYYTCIFNKLHYCTSDSTEIFVVYIVKLRAIIPQLPQDVSQGKVQEGLMPRGRGVTPGDLGHIDKDIDFYLVQVVCMVRGVPPGCQNPDPF